MKDYEKEVLNSQLKDEKEILAKVKKTYKQALNDIDDKIAQLMGRTDKENLQSIIYQVDYQKALKSQIQTILNNLNTNQFDSISSYLTDSYDGGYLGAMYSLQKQGIPLVIPIDQESVVDAIVNNSKLSKKLYDKLKVDVGKLNKRVQAEVSRGISQGYSYSKIAQNIAGQMNIGYNNAMRIARTESHRIRNVAALDAQTKAKANGADIVKQWDATLDSRTRVEHQHLDGQIVDVDQPFEIDGHKAMCPGGFGVAELDINCRCAILQRAKWALDQEELQTLKDRAAYFELDKTESFDDYKKKYLEATKILKDNFITESDAKNQGYKIFEHVTKQENIASIYKNGIDMSKVGTGAGTNWGDGFYATDDEVAVKFYKHRFDTESTMKIAIKGDELKEINITGKQLYKSKPYSMYDDAVLSSFNDEEVALYKKLRKANGNSKEAFVQFVKELNIKGLNIHDLKVQTGYIDVVVGGNQAVVYDKSIIKLIDKTENIAANQAKNAIKDVKVIKKTVKSSILKVGNDIVAKVPDAKLVSYALNPLKSPGKAKGFETLLGYTKENYLDLVNNILEHIDVTKFVEKGDNGYGMRYEYIIEIIGANGQKANVLTAWIEDDNGKRLTSIYVIKRKVTK